MPLTTGLLPEFDHEMATTRTVLERCKEDKYDWKPHPKSFSLGGLATHLANMPGWTAMIVKDESFDVAPVGKPGYKEEPAKNQKELLAKFDKNVADARAAIAGASDEALLQQWSLLGGGQPIFTMPRIAVLRSMIMNHSIHHRGQLSVYLRLNEIPVPAMYGPSADEQVTPKSASA